MSDMSPELQRQLRNVYKNLQDQRVKERSKVTDSQKEAADATLRLNDIEAALTEMKAMPGLPDGIFEDIKAS